MTDLNRRESIQKQYEIRFSKTESYRQKVWSILCSAFFSKYINKNSVVMDVGTGYGEFINNIDADIKYAIDINPTTKDKLEAGIEFLQQDCSKKWKLESDTLDIVFMSNLLEHLNDKETIELVISESYRCLKNKGLIILLGPNIKMVYKSYWDFWDHKVPLSEKSITELLKIKGFEIEVCYAKFLPYTMSEERQYPSILVLMYLYTKLFWFLFGKQFLVIGRKCSSSSASGVIIKTAHKIRHKESEAIMKT